MFINKNIILRLTLRLFCVIMVICAAAHSLEAKQLDTSAISEAKDSKPAEISESEETNFR